VGARQLDRSFGDNLGAKRFDQSWQLALATSSHPDSTAGSIAVRAMTNGPNRQLADNVLRLAHATLGNEKSDAVNQDWLFDGIASPTHHGRGKDQFRVFESSGNAENTDEFDAPE
jgi:hypothetical protein